MFVLKSKFCHSTSYYIHIWYEKLLRVKKSLKIASMIGDACLLNEVRRQKTQGQMPLYNKLFRSKNNLILIQEKINKIQCFIVNFYDLKCLICIATSVVFEDDNAFLPTKEENWMLSRGNESSKRERKKKAENSLENNLKSVVRHIVSQKVVGHHLL